MLESAESATDRICALLGGLAAEQVVLGEALNGSGLGVNSDLEPATKLAAQMLFEWGLGDQLAYSPMCALAEDRTKTNYLRLHPDESADGGHVIGLYGELAAILELVGPGNDKAHRFTGGLSVQVVAGVGFEPTTFRL